MNTTYVAEPTAKQLGYLSNLLDQADRLLSERERITGCEWPEATAEVARMRDTDGRTRREVSAMIETAKRNNGLVQAELESLGWEDVPTMRPANGRTYVATGMYQVGDRIFKVLPSRNSDRHYAKELTGEPGDGYSFTYCPGAMGLIREEHKMTPEQAAEFGRLTGSCCCCGRLLTDPQSIADGIGPVCKGKYFA